MGFLASLQDIFKLKKDGGAKQDGKGDIDRQSGSVLSSLNFMAEFMEMTEGYPSSERVSLEKLKYMYQDEAIKNACDFLSYTAMKKIGIDGYTHDDPQIQELVNNAIQNMDGSFYSHCRDLLQKGIFYGFSCLQLVFDKQESDYLFGWMVNYDSPDLSFKVAKNERGKEFISGVRYKSQEFSAKNFIVYQHGNLSNLYGYGRGNYAEWYYDIKILCIKLWPMFIQKHTIPTIIVKTVNDIKILMNKVSKWLYNNIIGIHKDQDEIELIERKSGLDASQIYENCLEYCNKIIYRIFFMPSLLSGGEKGGSYALGDKHFDLFMGAAEEIAEDFKDNVLISQIVVKLIEYNLGPQLDYGKFNPSQSLSLDDLQKIASVFFQLVNAGELDPATDSDWMRERLNFPKREATVNIESILTQDQNNFDNNKAEEAGEPNENNVTAEDTNQAESNIPA